MKRVYLFVSLCSFLTVLMLSGCSRSEKPAATSRLQVVTTLYPQFDFARIIGGDRADVSLLLPPGMEPHSFEPKPNDIVRIANAGLFIFTNPAMEPWAARVLSSLGGKAPRTVDASQGIVFAPLAGDDDHGHGTNHDDHHRAAGELDPHIWLDFANAVRMVDSIANGFATADPAGEHGYRQRAEALKTSLADLDRRYREGLSGCASRVLLHGGHFTFGYLARRYGLEYRSLSGISSESEPSAARMAAMVRQIKSSGARYLFAEELLSTRLSEALAAETGVGVLMLHGAHNVGRDDASRPTGFIHLMDRNLDNLKKGLGCRQK